MLQPIPLLDKDLDLYRVAAGEAAVERILALAEPLRGARVLHINSTAREGALLRIWPRMSPCCAAPASTPTGR